MKSYKRESSDSFYIQRCNNNDVGTDRAHKTNDHSSERSEKDGVNNESDMKDKHKKNLKKDESNEHDENNKNNDGCANEALYLYHYPNLCVNRYGSWMDTNIVWPDGADKCIVEFEWFVHRDLAGDSDYIEMAIAQSETVQTEDITLCNRYAHTYVRTVHIMCGVCPLLTLMKTEYATCCMY